MTNESSPRPGSKDHGPSGDVAARVKDMLRPLEAVPFPTAIEVLTGYKVLELDRNDVEDHRFLTRLGAAAHDAASRARSEGIATDRPNEAGNEIEKFVVAALTDKGFRAGIPPCRSGKARSAGYPDIRVSDDARTACVNCKTYSAQTKGQTLRSFYLSPSSDPKITEDAFHLLMSFELATERRSGVRVFVPVRWGIYELARLKLHVKFEFNASNSELYTDESRLLWGRFDRNTADA